MIDRIMPYLIPIILVIIGIIYYYCDPELYLWAPKCPWWLLTHTYCPSCGIQRMLFHLFHGEFCLAFKVNPFLVVSIPYAIAAVLGKWYNYHHIFDKLYAIVCNRVTIYIYVILFFAWWIIRNL